MIRHLARLADETFDTLVVGGGIYGLATAHALIQQGLSVALIEGRDFGGATSFNSLKTVHGGIRALQHGAIADAREFVRERRAVATLAPHLVRVLPFVVPTALHPIRNRTAMRLFLQTYDLVSRDRNAGVDAAVHLPRSYTVGRRRALQLNPAIDPRGVTGAAVWHDYQLHSPERFAIAIARAIDDAGGAIANYVEAASLLRDGNHIAGVRAKDALTGDPFDIRAALTINATGPWAWQLLAGAGLRVPEDAGFSLAMNLVVQRPPPPHALGGIAAGRFLFLVPWRDRSILGTSHEGFHRDPGTRPGPADVAALLHDGASAFPRLGLTAEDIRLVHRGLLPSRAYRTAHGALLKRSIVRDHRADGLSGLLSVVGVRYTTARATAQAVAHFACQILDRRLFPIDPQPLPDARFEDLGRYLRDHTPLERLIRRYGTLHTELPTDALTPLAAGTDVTRAEVLHAIRSEMALTLADVVLRRTDLATGGHPGVDRLRAAAALMAAERGWSAIRTSDEIARVEQELAI